MHFQYHLPVNLIFGRRRVSEIGVLSRQYGKRVLVVSGTNSTRRTGLLDRVLTSLKDSGLECFVFDKVTQNPLTTTALEGAELVKQTGCEVVVGLGGGSVMDCAKAIAFLVVNDGDINDYIFGRISGEQALPLILIPTTCGTGSEGNEFAVLTNPENGDKKSLRSNAIIAKASVVDSSLMESMPKHILAAVGFDALCHLMEAYVSKAAQPLTDMMCRTGIGLIAVHLPRLYTGDGAAEDWDAVAWASTLGGMVINSAGVTLPHAMEHPASGLRNIVHGMGLAALTPVIIDASFAGASEKYRDISVLLGGTSAADCGLQVRRLLCKLGLDTRLSDMGIQREDIAWMAENCMRVSGVSAGNHPVNFGVDEIKCLYQTAF